MKSDTKQIKNTAGMFDLLKGLTMIMVVVVHTLQDFENVGYGRTLNMMGVFMVALFVISGYGFRAKNLKKAFVQQFQLIGIPYIVTSILTCVLHCIVRALVYGSKRSAVVETIKLFIGLTLGLSDTVVIKDISLFSCGPMWYLLALFWAWIFMTIIFKFVPEKWRTVAVIIVSIIGVPLNFIKFDPWCIYRGMFATIFVYSGYYCKKHKIFTKIWDVKYKALLWASLILVIVDLGFHLENTPLSLVLFPLIIIYPPVFVKMFLWFNRFTGPVSNGIRNIGRYSLYFLCIHSCEYLGFVWYELKGNTSHTLVAGICLFRIIMDSILCILVAKILSLKKVK